MTGTQVEQWVADLRDFEHEAEMLTRSISDLDRATGPGRPTVYLTAQVMRHRIRMALLASRLDVPLETS